MTAPHRRPRDARTAAHRAAPSASTGPRSARSAPLGASRPAHRRATDRPTDRATDRATDSPTAASPTAASPTAASPTDSPTDSPTEQAPHAAGAARVPEIVPVGSVVGLDDSAAVRALAVEVVAAGAALVGTSSFETLAVLTATAQARTGAVTIRLFGGVHQAGACTGPAGLQAVTSTHCDVALVGGRLVGDEVWVPSAAYGVRRALLLAATRAYLVPETTGHTRPDGWTRLGALAEFAGTARPLAPPGAALDHAVA